MLLLRILDDYVYASEALMEQKSMVVYAGCIIRQYVPDGYDRMRSCHRPSGDAA